MEFRACGLRLEHGYNLRRLTSHRHNHRNNKSELWSIQDDTGNELYIEDPISIKTPFEINDPFRLVKSALLVTGIVQEKTFLDSTGLEIKTWANVPRGSGLGTSSILAAAVVKGLLQISNGDESNENVARLILVLEQLMGTGGGWQDQIGGLYPGIKFTSSHSFTRLAY